MPHNKDQKETGSILLLLAADDIFQKMLVKVLKSERYKLALAKDTKQALKKAETGKIDIILIDEEFIAANCPFEDDFILKLKNAGSSAPILLMVTPEVKENLLIPRLLSSGNIEECIFKPFLPQSLISITANVITKNKKKLTRAKDVLPVSSHAAERRKFIRRNVPVEVFFSYIDKFQLPPSVIEQKTKSKDISAGGIRLDVGLEMNIPTYLDLKLLIPSEKSILH
jgi:DNA-binding response OmpR family regulator